MWYCAPGQLPIPRRTIFAKASVDAKAQTGAYLFAGLELTQDTVSKGALPIKKKRKSGKKINVSFEVIVGDVSTWARIG